MLVGVDTKIKKRKEREYSYSDSPESEIILHEVEESEEEAEASERGEAELAKEISTLAKELAYKRGLLYMPCALGADVDEVFAWAMKLVLDKQREKEVMDR